MTGDLFEEDSAAQATNPSGRNPPEPAPAAPVDRTSIEYYARLQHFYRFGAWPEDADQT